MGRAAWLQLRPLDPFSRDRRAARHTTEEKSIPALREIACRLGGRSAVLALGLLALAAPAASAATATVTSGALTYTAVTGETNNLLITRAGGSFTLSDTTASLGAGTGCSSTGYRTVTCAATTLSLDAGDRDDVITLGAGAPATLNAGSGNDQLLDPSGGAANTFIGGTGTDRVSYAGRTAAVAADIDAVADDGAPGELDDVRTDVEDLYGGSGADQLTGGTAANRLVGMAGDDALDGAAGDDTIDGGPGADGVNGGLGRDFADYGARTLALTVDFDDVADDGEPGEGDNLHSDLEGVYGGGAADVLTGGPGNDSLRGNGGDDTFKGNGGADSFVGGAGQDTADYSGTTVAVLMDNDGVADDGAAGEQDNVGTDVDNLIGGEGNDTITGSTWANTITGGDGNDTLSGRDGNDTVRGGDGEDTLRGENHDDVLDGQGGADVIAGGSGTDTADYSLRSAPLLVSVGDGADDGGISEFDDVQSDVERVSGGAGDDEITGDSSSEALIGGGGNDQLNGVTGDDSIQGGTGNDVLLGSGGRDTLDGGSGADRIDGGTSGDTMIGGADTDATDYSARTNRVTVDLDNSADDGESGEGDNARNDIENVIGGAGDDRITGDADTNGIAGGSGDDTLDGGSGADGLDGGPDDDSLKGGTGGDNLGGGDGADTADYADRSRALAVSIDGAANDGEAGEGDGVAGDIERITGGSAGDVLSGDERGNTLVGGRGADLLAGAGGDDALDGGDGEDALRAGYGADRVTGGRDRDTIDFSDRGSPVTVELGRRVTSDGDTVSSDVENAAGGSGPDRLVGSEGENTLSGGDGDDVLAGSGGADRLSGGNGSDTADYSDRRDKVVIKMNADADDGSVGERDLLGADVENANGGQGPDELVGDGSANRLSGGAGNDKLTGGKGVDTFDAGAGNDQVNSKDGKAEKPNCGSGRDRADADKGDKLKSCESRGKAGPIPTSGSPTPPKPSTTPGNVKGVRTITGKGRIVAIPGFPGERVDSRLLKDIAWMKKKYKIHVTDGYAMAGHAANGEHPIGAGLDIVPGPGGSWSDIDKLAKFAEPRQNRPRAPFRWVGYNGDYNHGRGNHLHLSWNHGPARRGAPARWIQVMTYQEKPRTLAIRSLTKLAQSTNARIGRAPSVKSGLKTVARCSGASPLKPTWKAAGKAFGIRWQILAAITQIESGFGCNMGPSSAGAIGWTQFMPATWRAWGMDASGDRKASPYNSSDAIFSSARYLRASGAPGNYRKAIFAYNHATWYVNQVLGLSRKFHKAVDPNAALPDKPLGSFRAADNVPDLPPTTLYDLDAGDPIADPLPAPTRPAPRIAPDADETRDW